MEAGDGVWGEKKAKIGEDGVWRRKNRVLKQSHVSALSLSGRLGMGESIPPGVGCPGNAGRLAAPCCRGEGRRPSPFGSLYPLYPALL